MIGHVFVSYQWFTSNMNFVWLTYYPLKAHFVEAVKTHFVAHLFLFKIVSKMRKTTIHTHVLCRCKTTPFTFDDNTEKNRKNTMYEIIHIDSLKPVVTTWCFRNWSALIWKQRHKSLSNKNQCILNITTILYYIYFLIMESHLKISKRCINYRTKKHPRLCQRFEERFS